MPVAVGPSGPSSKLLPVREDGLCDRMRTRGWELMGSTGKTMMQSGSTFDTFVAIGMGIQY
ncbi:Reactive oxygen species modulator 1 [Camelus dromedarius]|uniref:Reactive oxygen species modulator 1 n=1 Tax=Camelus dromedarius TaxID=9838 RepID=A0A5N4CP84_CAMDR|nr:Reactive oxygen species modulator 1 [Camelus dromedarius]